MARLKMLLDATKVGSQAETLEERLRARIVGQDAAIRQIVDVYQTFLAGMCPNDRPIGNFLFLGPTGSGKTRTVEAVAESLVGDRRAVIKIDCAEYQHGHEIAKLIGSPPGYLGHKETHPLLCQEVLDQHQTADCRLSFVLFDEIEKSSDALWNLLLGILDKATLTLGDNRRVDFSHTMIFLTSNLGAAEMAAILRPKLGFATGAPAEAELNGKMASAGTNAARRRFSPEFMNRIDKTVVFNSLGREQMRRILDLELEAVHGRILSATGAAALSCTLDQAARDYLLAEGTDSRYGARHLKRAVERLLVQPLSNLIATGQVRGDDRVMVEYERDLNRLIFSKESADPAPAGTVAGIAA
jgi:ATP-dependent Clp protease ATP-binding subunit ClpB